jgi:hypothetical protein
MHVRRRIHACVRGNTEYQLLVEPGSKEDHESRRYQKEDHELRRYHLSQQSGATHKRAKARIGCHDEGSRRAWRAVAGLG